MTTCSVIIVNYNTGKLLKQAVDAALSNDGVNEVIVVDNHSKDQSMDLIDESDRVKKYFRKKNYGFAAGCNYGAKLAIQETGQEVGQDILLFLNPDCIVQQNTIDELASALCKQEYKQEYKQEQKQARVGIIGCRVNNPNGTEQRASRRRLPTLLRAIKTFLKIEKLAKYCQCFAGVNLNHLPMPKEIQQVEAISGAFIMMKAVVFNEINGFDEKFPLHFEDLDLFKRTHDLGYAILFNPNVEVVHYQGTSSQSNPKVEEMKAMGLQRYFYKHCSVFSYFLVKLLR